MIRLHTKIDCLCAYMLTSVFFPPKFGINVLLVFQAEKENRSTEEEEKTCTHIKNLQTLSEKAKSVVILCSFNLTRIERV